MLKGLAKKSDSLWYLNMNIGIASLVHINLLIKRSLLFNICLGWPLSKSLEAVLNENLIGSPEAIHTLETWIHYFYHGQPLWWLSCSLSLLPHKPTDHNFGLKVNQWYSQLWMRCWNQVITRMVTPVNRTPYGEDGAESCQWCKALMISWIRQHKWMWCAEHIQDGGLSQKKLNHITRTYGLTL